MEIKHRPLTQAEAVRLHQELKLTPNILGYTVYELKRLSDVYVAEVKGKFAGACFSVDLIQNWTEIAALCVLAEFRGQEIGKSLFEAAWTRAQERRRHIYLLSRNPQVIGWMRAKGMRVDSDLWRAPAAVHWYMGWYMASWYRSVESVRKRNAIRQCPPLLQGILRYTKEKRDDL